MPGHTKAPEEEKSLALGDDIIDAFKESFEFVCNRGGSEDAKSKKTLYNGDAITPAAIKELLKLKQQTVSNRELSAIMQMRKKDLTKNIEFGEFLSEMAKSLEVEEDMVGTAAFEKKAIDLFSMFDRDENGKISLEDLVEMMEVFDEDVSEEECMCMIEAASKGKSKSINLKEFMHLMLCYQSLRPLRGFWRYEESCEKKCLFCGCFVDNVRFCGAIHRNRYCYPWWPDMKYWPQLIKRPMLTSFKEDFLHWKPESTHFNTGKISIIIPVYNDGAEILRKSLAVILQNSSNPDGLEIVIVDAGCVDDTINAVDEFKNAALSINLIKLPPNRSGRGGAMRFGAESATGSILFFLHCDTLVPEDFDSSIRKVVDDNILVTFRFHVKHKGLLNTLTNNRARYFWIPYGDQGFIMTRNEYDRIGGFKEMKMMEDFDLIWRIRDDCLNSGTSIRVLDKALEVSDRRWQKHGTVYNSFRNWIFVASYVLFGLPPETIFKYYYRS